MVVLFSLCFPCRHALLFSLNQRFDPSEPFVQGYISHSYLSKCRSRVASTLPFPHLREPHHPHFFLNPADCGRRAKRRHPQPAKERNRSPAENDGCPLYPVSECSRSPSAVVQTTLVATVAYTEVHLSICSFSVVPMCPLDVFCVLLASRSSFRHSHTSSLTFLFFFEYTLFRPSATARWRIWP